VCLVPLRLLQRIFACAHQSGIHIRSHYAMHFIPRDLTHICGLSQAWGLPDQIPLSARMSFWFCMRSPVFSCDDKCFETGRSSTQGARCFLDMCIVTVLLTDSHVCRTTHRNGVWQGSRKMASFSLRSLSSQRQSHRCRLHCELG
jgi:hypothetical protein